MSGSIGGRAFHSSAAPTAIQRPIVGAVAGVTCWGSCGFSTGLCSLSDDDYVSAPFSWIPDEGGGLGHVYHGEVSHVVAGGQVTPSDMSIVPDGGGGGFAKDTPTTVGIGSEFRTVSAAGDRASMYAEVTAAAVTVDSDREFRVVVGADDVNWMNAYYAFSCWYNAAASRWDAVLWRATGSFPYLIGSPGFSGFSIAIATTTGITAPAVGQTIRVERSGATLTGLVNGASVVSGAITAGTGFGFAGCGLFANVNIADDNSQSGWTTGDISIDDFSACSL